MALREKVFAVALAVSTGVSGWMWNLHASLDSTVGTHTTQIAVLEATKASKDEVALIQQQLAVQTTILENQSKLMEQQHELIKDLANH